MDVTQPSERQWWRESQIFWLIAIVVAIFGSRIGDLNLAGEETRRAQVAAEMLWSGDWLVPHQQGKIYLTRPPLGNWVIAVTALVWGELDAFAVRFPTQLAVLLTTLVIYGYTRNFLSKSGAFLAAVTYPTMAQVLQLGRVAESEGLFTFFISSSLLVWHWGYLKRWPAWVMWSAGYALAAMAGLTKGPQGIAYFVGPIGVFLLIVERDWRTLFRPAHALGILVGAGLIACWQVPYMAATSLEAGKAVWFTQASNRFEYSNLGGVALHLVRFPLEILACTCPWSLALVQFFNRNFWQSVKDIRSEMRFLFVALAVTFPTVWLAPHARGRYFMPLYPLIGILCGIVLDRCAHAEARTWMKRGWQQFVLGLLGVSAVAGIGLAIVTMTSGLLPTPLGIPAVLSWGFAGVALGGMVWVIRNWHADQHRMVQGAAVCVAIVLGWAYTGLIVSTHVARQPNTKELLSRVKQEVPEEQTLVSFGRVTHAFTYYYGKFVPQREWPEESTHSEAGDYFCCLKVDVEANPLPFEWEKIAEMTFEDGKKPSKRSYVVVGRRLPVLQTAAQHSDEKH